MLSDKLDRVRKLENGDNDYNYFRNSKAFGLFNF